MNKMGSKNDSLFPNQKTVYGPVKSWRFGQSLGIDPIFHTSTCSFNCIYCQLGEIQSVTREHKEYVPTERVINDFKEIYEKEHIDIITYSGSGEPTLANNLSQMITQIREIAPQLTQGILTNGTELSDPEVQKSLLLLDQVTIKLDSLSPEVFQKVNRPEKSVNLENIVKSIIEFKKIFTKPLFIQTMFMPINSKEIKDYAEVINLINPTEIQLNTPKRPYPLSWHRENRGNHLLIFDYEVRKLNALTHKQAMKVEEELRSLTQVPISSIYR